jgi:hypothetical protein
MKKILLLVGCLLAISANAGKLFPELAKQWYPHQLTKSTPQRFTGPFDAGEVDFYIVHHGGNLTITLIATRSKLHGDPVSRALLSQAIFFRLFDAKEVPLKKQFFVFPEGKGIKTKSFKLKLKKVPPGIYQLRCAISQNSSIKVDIKTKPTCSFGVAPSRGLMLPTTKKQFADAYLYTPPDCQQLKFRFYGAVGELFMLNGNSVQKFKSPSITTVKVTPDTIYKLKAINVWHGFGIDGAPSILCPDAATARNIRGSVEFAQNGRLLYHQFQVRNWKWMHGLKANELTAPPIADLKKYRKEFLDSPGSETLIGPAGFLSHAGYLLKTQNLNPASQDYGNGGKFYYLASMWGLKAPFNPYAGNKNILNRFLMNVYARHMELKENGTFHTGWSSYSGGDALHTLGTYIPFYLYGKKVPRQLYAPWLNTITPLIDRFGMNRVGCENQTAHWLVDLECMYLGGGGQVYNTMAKDFALHLCSTKYNPYLKAGYLQENYAVDASYNGLSASNVAFYYMISGDKNAKNALSKIYNLFNHTIAQEPDNTPYAATAFSHRTTGSWRHRQWNGGVNLMKNELSGAGVWTQHSYPQDPPELFLKKYLGWKPDDKWYKQNKRWAEGYSYSPWLKIWRDYFVRDPKVVKGQFPATKSAKFTSIFDNKFYFFREPTYYAYAFVAKDWYDWVKNQRKIIPYNPGWQLNGKTLTAVTATAKKKRWSAIQGLMMFWTPQYGNCILAKNWNIYTGQFVRAEMADGKVSWPDYWSVKSHYNGSTKTLTIEHQMLNLPITIKRSLTFSKNAVKVNLLLKFTEDVHVKTLVEQLPFLKKAGMKLKLSPGLALFTNTTGKGVSIKLNRPLKMSTGFESKLHKQTIGSLLINLGNKHKKGTIIKLNYTLTAL